MIVLKKSEKGVSQVADRVRCPGARKGAWGRGAGGDISRGGKGVDKRYEVERRGMTKEGL